MEKSKRERRCSNTTRVKYNLNQSLIIENNTTRGLVKEEISSVNEGEKYPRSSSLGLTQSFWKNRIRESSVNNEDSSRRRKTEQLLMLWKQEKEKEEQKNTEDPFIIYKDGILNKRMDLFLDHLCFLCFNLSNSIILCIVHTGTVELQTHEKEVPIYREVNLCSLCHSLSLHSLTLRSELLQFYRPLSL
jgi:hypothetical protein